MARHRLRRALLLSLSMSLLASNELRLAAACPHHHERNTQLTTIELLPESVFIRELVITRRDIVDFLTAVPEAEREALAVQAFEVGVFCLERARTGASLDFVRREVDRLLVSVGQAVDALPGLTKEKLLGSLGTGDGQVLAPVHELLKQVQLVTGQQLREVRDLLANEIDPSKDTSTIGKALRSVTSLLDADRTDSIQGRLGETLRTLTTVDGPLAATVKGVVIDAIGPLAAEVDRLRLVVTAREAAAAALANTTVKGLTFEEEVVARIHAWGGTAGLQIVHCGTDNHPGDILVTAALSGLAEDQATMMIECRDRADAAGRKPIGDAMDSALRYRNAHRGIFLARGREGLAKEVGDWAEGTAEHGPWVATTAEHLVTALRFSFAMERLSRVAATSEGISPDDLVAHIARVRDGLRRLTTINARVTDIRSNADAISTEAGALRSDITGALQSLEDVLNRSDGESDAT